MGNYEFTKSHTQIAKGVAIVLMLLHHLYAFPERIQDVSYISIIPGNHFDLEFVIGAFGKLCVDMYLFLSGYGLYIMFSKKGSFNFRDSLDRIYRFLIRYWLIFLLFVPIGLIWFSSSARYNFEPIEFIKNFLTLSDSYNGEWWFVRLYIELLIIFPLLKKILDKKQPVSFIIPLSLYISHFIISIAIIQIPAIRSITNNILFSDLHKILFWQMTFCTGYLTAKYNLFSKLNMHLKSSRVNKNWFYIFVLILTILIRTVITKRTSSDDVEIYSTLIDFLLSAIFILFSTNLIYNTRFNKIIGILGNHSTNIWLTHTFFAYYYFQPLVFYPRLSIIILLWLIILSLTSSILIERIFSLIRNI